jgi:hypothetical protein
VRRTKRKKRTKTFLLNCKYYFNRREINLLNEKEEEKNDKENIEEETKEKVEKTSKTTKIDLDSKEVKDSLCKCIIQ